MNNASTITAADDAEAGSRASDNASTITAADGETGVGNARLCRVSVLCGGSQADLSLPPDATVEMLVPELVRVFGDRLAGTAEHSWARPWRLARVGGDSLPVSRTLADAQISDGALLVLYLEPGLPVTGVFDDTVSAASEALAPRRRWDAAAAGTVGLVVTAGATAAGCALTLHTAARGGPWPAVAAAVEALVLLTAAALMSWCRAATVLTYCAVAAAAAAAVAALPAVHNYGAAHLMLALVAAAAVTSVGLRVPGVYRVPGIALLTAAMLIAPAAGIVLWAPGLVTELASTIAVLGYLIVLCAPRIGSMIGRLPLPHVPAAGEHMDPIDDEPPPIVAGVGAVPFGTANSAAAGGTAAAGATAGGGPLGALTAAQLRDRVRAADAVTSGLVIGSAISSAAGALLVGTAGRVPPLGHLLFVIAIAMALALRGRTHADPLQAGTTTLAGAVIAIATATSLAWGSGYGPAWGAAGLAGLAVLACGCGVLAPRHRFTPVQRRLAELGEYLVIAAVGPLLGWVWDVYSLVRNL